MAAGSADTEVFGGWHELPEHFRLSSALFGCMCQSVNVLQTKRTRGILQHHNYGPEISFTVFFLSSYLLGLKIRFLLHPFVMITFSDVPALLMATESGAVCDTRYLRCVHKKMKIQDFRVSAQQWKYVREQQIIGNGNKRRAEELHAQ